MSVNILRGRSDAVVETIVAALNAYERDHPESQIDVYRQNSVSVRVRIIDPDLARFSKSQRNELVWRYFDVLSEDEQSDISMLLLLTPNERKNSFANSEFEDPSPSEL